jgi:hypothetical protein
METKRPMVFISHHSDDALLAQEFARLLKNASGGHLKSFYSSDNKSQGGIPFGDEWYGTLMSKLSDASDVVVLLTQRSIERPWVLYEAGAATGKLDAKAIGLILGIPADKARTGPFGVLQNCENDEHQITKLVLQLIRRDPDVSQEEEGVRPHVKKFRSRVKTLLEAQEESDSRTHTQTLHYVKKIEPASDFFNRFYSSLSTVISMDPKYGIQYHSTPLDPYGDVCELLRTLPSSDAVMVTAKNLDQKQHAIQQLILTLKKYPKSRLIFVDREPPRELLTECSNTSYVGINNKRVGVAAGYALFRALERLGRQHLYVVVNGPGGHQRAGWCEKTVTALDPGVALETVEIKDDDRRDTGAIVCAELDKLRTLFPEASVGLFTGNDETATSLCHHSLKNGYRDIHIVGCDATREMRQWVESWADVAVATILNNLHEEGSIAYIKRAMSERELRSLDPYLYPKKLQRQMEDNPIARRLWEDARWVM